MRTILLVAKWLTYRPGAGLRILSLADFICRGFYLSRIFSVANLKPISEY
jgi:hypothetical protein